jgi:hypothetical protein
MPALHSFHRFGVSRLVLGALALLLVAVTPAPGADNADTSSVDELPAPGTLPGSGEVLPAVAMPLGKGESLKFSVQYGNIKAGSAWLEVTDVGTYDGHPVYTLVARAESNGFFSKFYKVRNRIESYWDSSGHFSRRYTEKRREGKYKVDSDIRFDYARQEAVYKDGRTFPIPPGVQDGLSSFYYTRTQALPVGGSVLFDYHASRKSAPMEVRVIGREKIKTPAGEFNCVAIEPILKAGGIFKNKGRLVIWLTDDERRMPVLMKSKVAIGSISVVLNEVKSGT